MINIDINILQILQLKSKILVVNSKGRSKNIAVCIPTCLLIHTCFFLESLPYFLEHYKVVLTKSSLSTRIFTFLTNSLPAPKEWWGKVSFLDFMKVVKLESTRFISSLKRSSCIEVTFSGQKGWDNSCSSFFFSESSGPSYSPSVSYPKSLLLNLPHLYTS